MAPPHTIAEGSQVLAGVSGEAKLLALEERTLAAAWIATAVGAKDHDATILLVSFSKDGGSTWTSPITPSEDKTEGEHEYAGLFPLDGEFGMVWLDPHRTVPPAPGWAHSNIAVATILLTTTFTREACAEKKRS
jgi:hypothetical protein